MRIYKDIVYYDQFPEDCKLDLYLPEEGDTFPVYVYFHGGGIDNGSKGGYDATAQYLTDRGFAVVSADYRMYPTAKYPEFLNDAAAAVAWVQKKSGEYATFTNIAVGGSSAGGYITMMLYFNPSFYRNQEVDPSQIKAYNFDAGQPTTHFNVLKFDRGMDSRRVWIDDAAPLFYLDKAYTAPEKEPHIVIFCADNDMVNRAEQLKMLHTAMLHMGFPEEKLTYKMFRNKRHCAYCKDEEYMEDVYQLLAKM